MLIWYDQYAVDMRAQNEQGDALFCTLQFLAYACNFLFEATRFRSVERARMAKVNRLLTTVKIVEIALMVAGIGLAAIAAGAENEMLTGVGVGLFAQSTIMLTLDMFAADRGLRYHSQL